MGCGLAVNHPQRSCLWMPGAVKCGCCWSPHCTLPVFAGVPLFFCVAAIPTWFHLLFLRAKKVILRCLLNISGPCTSLHSCSVWVLNSYLFLCLYVKLFWFYLVPTKQLLPFPFQVGNSCYPKKIRNFSAFSQCQMTAQDPQISGCSYNCSLSYF